MDVAGSSMIAAILAVTVLIFAAMLVSMLPWMVAFFFPLSA